MRWRGVALVLASALVLSGCIGNDASQADANASGTDAVSPETNASNKTIAWASVEEARIRPGDSHGGFCTFNFLFTAPNGTAYIGTAGHCTEGPGERVQLGSNGPEIGTVVVDSDNHSQIDDFADFSLIRLDAERVSEANPTVIGYDGPTRVLNASDASQGDQVAFHGYGVVVGQTGPTRNRTGVLISMTEQQYDADMPAVNGDSGSPLLHESGAALGIISHYGTGNTPPTTDEGPTVAFILDELHRVGWNLQLATTG